MATVTPGYTFISNEVATPTKLNQAATPTVSVANDEITTAKILDANVTLAKLAAAVQQALLPAGAVQAFAMNAAPSGWLAANGTAVSRTTYAALFSAIGTTYGTGDGSTTFALPDLRGYFVRGSGTNSDGTAAGTFGAKQADAFLNHNHTATSSTDGAHTHNYNSYTYFSSTAALGGAVDAWRGVGAVATTSAGSHSHTITVANSTTGGTETRPKNIALLYCIKF
jgi:microcystin-dependent protein